MKKYYLLTLAFFCSFLIRAQEGSMPVFGDDSLMAFIEEGGDYIYNLQYDSAELYINEVKRRLPGHPIGYMMEAVNIAWLEQPIRTTSPNFPKHKEALMKCLAAAEKLREADPYDKEGVFFEMSVHGLLSEYYAREGSYMKAMGEARKTYSLIKKTMEWTAVSTEFYFLAGLYNYFREKYPEQHSIYKTFMWIFKSGDMEKGLVQLDSAVHYSKIVKIEAHLYLTYIYLRYENNPGKAIYYVERLRKRYPKNNYFKAKYLECEVLLNGFDDALPVIYDLMENEDPYYRMCALTYHGLYYESVSKSDFDAKTKYEAAIAAGQLCPEKGEFYRSMAFLGLGKIVEKEGNLSLATYYYNTALDIDENDQVSKEAQERLDALD